jgi:NAD-dependent SIR2 family protein deacetylase
MCDCEFDPYADCVEEESWHFKRTCEFCGYSWYGLHCPHDGHQNPCPECGKRPTVVPEPDEDEHYICPIHGDLGETYCPRC